MAAVAPHTPPSRDVLEDADDFTDVTDFARLKDSPDDNDKDTLVEKQHEQFVPKRNIGAWLLASMIFFWTVGGPFGIEAAVQSGGPFYSMVALLCVGLFSNVPIALMSAELSLMMPLNGGQALWPLPAMGHFVYFLNFGNLFLSQVASVAIQVFMFDEYLGFSYAIHGYSALSTPALLACQFAIRAFLVVVCFFVNVKGSKLMSRFNAAILPYVFVPFFVMLGIALHRGDVSPITWAQTISSQLSRSNFADFVATMIWTWTGYDTIGSLAGEVKGGRRTYLLGMFITFPFSILNYVVPVFTGFAIERDSANWSVCCLTKIAYSVSTLCYVLMATSAALCYIGQYGSAVNSLARIVWSMAGQPPETRLLPHFLSYSTRTELGTVRPLAALAATSLAVLLASFAGYSLLVQLWLLSRVLNLGCEFAALIVLRHTAPDTPRPFCIPGGYGVLALLTLPQAVILTTIIVTAGNAALVTGLLFQPVLIVVYLLIWGRPGRAGSHTSAPPEDLAATQTLVVP
eukprot:gnl/Spiro4/27131_TR13494_c0_g1_i1.p1 gnl/Spiro4/27131_TR13494_c0_g1~~gnl/Spiro4/27131_TR13494_c0_g1_i1.p1  ORF type:complete len:534 (+),score=163.02 gnl/Spiro4/27131_TR13494_c0_g1_i1:56-1603(+)